MMEFTKNVSILILHVFCVITRCPFDPQIISKFQVNSDGTQAMAVLRSMFKFPEDSEVHIQCDVAQCFGGCYNDVCPGDVLTAGVVGKQPTGNGTEDATMLAATTVFVLDPADAPRSYINTS